MNARPRPCAGRGEGCAVCVVGGYGGFRHLVTGLLGAIVGSYLFAALNIRLPIGDPLITQIVVAAIGAIVLVLLARLIVRT